MTAKLDPPCAAPCEHRLAERHSCALPTTCQPPSAWCKDPWPATIRNLSTAGLNLTLNRRFERGSGLAIELPTVGGATATVLARVVEVVPYPEGGWLLGCDFISELSEGDVFGEPGLLEGSIREASVTVVSAVADVLYMSRENFQYLVHKVPAFAWGFWRPRPTPATCSARPIRRCCRPSSGPATASTTPRRRSREG